MKRYVYPIVLCGVVLAVTGMVGLMATSAKTTESSTHMLTNEEMVATTGSCNDTDKDPTDYCMTGSPIASCVLHGSVCYVWGSAEFCMRDCDSEIEGTAPRDGDSFRGCFVKQDCGSDGGVKTQIGICIKVLSQCVCSFDVEIDCPRNYIVFEGC